MIFFDSMYLCWKNWYTFKDRIDNGVLYGVIQDLKRIPNLNKGVVVWDRTPEVKLSIFPEYKRERRLKPKEDALWKQIEQVEQFFQMLGFRQVWKTGHEADDVIASMIRPFDRIISNDKDFYQLFDLRVSQYNFLMMKSLGWFRKEYAIEPKDWRWVLAISGCASDEIDGISGIGEITAIKLVKKYKSFDKIMNQSRYGELLKFNKGRILRNLRLVTLYRNLEIDEGIEPSPDHQGLGRFLGKLRFEMTLRKDSEFLSRLVEINS